MAKFISQKYNTATVIDNDNNLIIPSDSKVFDEKEPKNDFQPV